MIKTRALDEKEACGILELQLGGSSKPFLAFFIRFSTSSQYCRNSVACSLTPISKEPLLRRSTAQARRAAGHQRQARRRRSQGHLLFIIIIIFVTIILVMIIIITITTILSRYILVFDVYCCRFHSSRQQFGEMGRPWRRT